ncbi:hypothetical protein M2451_000778 [Dysgonomonas sp. PFB1-18]|uniref:hypothetical protein n=1 Tax=unclassified Dysgonomonas TaxID=2630389 RepID=UPI002473FD30|nr:MULTISPECIES: hypothetical protein [unclassified Dysgonomonas]MDH6308467.1 hypothetical protein [Dysgonomonas sp. PF1-14]MDH6337968.1 hypothetical protein [Dysgonomonas sp. PF1-16]MDH6379465.1 hypothetical protein [Dysgonomonas sp. PFB1-18]MDH6396796.1 hypothetical protein [Dysgonomonas sp. PF1-23]
MKTKLQILLFLMLSLCLTVVPTVVSAADSEKPVTFKATEAEKFMQEEKTSLVYTKSISMISEQEGFLSASEGWQDPFLPETDWSNPGNVGAPIGDTTLPIIFSIFVLYLIYRGVTTSRRRNNL